MPPVIKVKKLAAKNVPMPLRRDGYFDFEAHPFLHQQIFGEVHCVVLVLDIIGRYASRWLKNRIGEKISTKDVCIPISNQGFNVIMEKDSVFKPLSVLGSSSKNSIYISKGAGVFGANFFVSDGSVFIGKDTIIEPGATIKGPVIIGKNCQIRGSTYIRGPVLIGDGVVIGGEVKNSILMDRSEFPHVSYLGDSICGFSSHFGNQVTSANLGIFSNSTQVSGSKKNIIIECQGKYYDLGRYKIGIILGDFSQVGCGAVTSPGTFIGKNTVIYPLALLSKGFYSQNSVIKYRPSIEIVERLKASGTF
jgi:NDP-sugar pyrophosphorylase family protein